MPPNDLTARQVTELPPGKTYRVSKNLYLRNEPPNRSWIMIYRSPATHKHTEMGLGPYPLVSVPAARAAVKEHQLTIFHGRCPLQEKRATQGPRQAVFTFKAAADAYLAAHHGSWRSAAHRQNWEHSLRDYAFPVFGDLPVGQVDTGCVMQVLQPLWAVKTQTAFRLKGRIESVLYFAAARGWRTGENPARWRGHLSEMLPNPKKLRPVQHHAALDWRDLSALWCKLQGRDGLPALALRLIIATALRRGEVLEARWPEIDFEARVWTLPAARTKSNREFKIPLADAALEMLTALAMLRRDDLLFPGAKHGRPIAATMLLDLLGELRPGVTIHGFRATFRSWCADNRVPREIAELSLAHRIEDATERAYQRSDVLGPRRAIMARWGRFLTSEQERGVVAA
jgi:integrase